MKNDYDFSKGERGKFFRKGAKFHLPIYLSDDNQVFIEKIAARKKRDFNTVVNDLLSKDKHLAKAIL